MGFTWTEIKKWAKSKGLEPKKTGSEYFWDGNKYNDLDSLVFSLYNKLTDNKWIDHQKNYEKSS